MAEEEKEKFLQEVVNSLGSGITAQQVEDTFADIKKVYDRNTQDIVDKQNELLFQYSSEDFEAILDRLESYYSEVERIEQDHANKMRELNENGASKSEKDKENELYQQRKAQADKKLSNDADEQAFAKRMTSFAQSIAGQTYEQIKAEYSKFLSILDNDISKLEQDIDGYKEEAKNNQNALTTTQGDLNEVNTQLGQDGLDEETRNDLLREREQLTTNIEAIEKRIRQNTANQQKAEQQLTTLTKGRQQAEQSALNAEENALTEKQKTEIQFQKDINATSESFGALKSAAQSVADTLGGAMSENAKKALQGIMDIAEIGQQSCQAIAAVSKAASVSVSETASAAEKASVILMAISAIVQVVMAAVKFFSQFTKSAQMQDSIDKTKERIEDLRREQQKLEDQYQSQVGGRYYKGLAKAARNYNVLIKENNTALKEAQELQKRQEKYHGEDSDKAKEAKEQVQELEDQQRELEQAQQEMYDELAQELLTTDVSSFASDLADSLVDAWQDGTKEMSEVWDDMLDDLQRSMIKKMLTTALIDLYTPVFDKMKEKTIDGELTMQEMDEVMDLMDSTTEQAQQIAEVYRQVLEQRGLLEDPDVEGDKGGFQSMSQDTADELNARFTALQIEGANVVTATNAMLDALTLMQTNSYRTALTMQNLELYAMNAQIAAEERLDVIRAIRDNTDLIVINTNRLKAIEQNTDRL